MSVEEEERAGGCSHLLGGACTSKGLPVTCTDCRGPASRVLPWGGGRGWGAEDRWKVLNVLGLGAGSQTC